MANFIVIVDQDFQRRSQFIKTIEPLLPPVGGLITNSCSTKDFHSIWSANRTAPISSIADEEGAAIIWGDAISRDSSTRIDAKSLRNLWSSPQTQYPIFDGFYAALAYHPQLGLKVGTDLLGIFPLYYYSSKDIILVGSSPELFQYHPQFKAQFNPVGLVGILLLNNLFEGQTLWQNVHRLGAGNLLTWQLGKSCQEIKQYQWLQTNTANKYRDYSPSEQLDILDQVLEQGIARQVNLKQKYSQLLSGGLDSRMLAGFLHRQGVDIISLTLGVSKDIEMDCAISVARTLGFEHHPITIPWEKYSQGAKLIAKWEHLSNGFNWWMNWDIYSYLPNFADKVILGLLLDRVVGGKSTGHISLDNLSFEKFFTNVVNPWGFSPQLLEKLLRQEVFGNLVQDTISRIRKIYEEYSDLEYKRTWWFEIQHRQRFHVGSVAWQVCFGAWPILPVLDQQLIEITEALPSETINERLAQKQLVCTRFPQLAQLPLDRGSYDPSPLLSSPIRNRLKLLFKLQKKWRNWQYKLGYERRYFQRILNINNSGGQTIRQEVESYRPLVKELFDEEIFNQLLPPPNISISRVNPHSSAEFSGIKALLGFLLWAKNHL